MSKKRGQRKKRRRKNQPAACPRCHGPADPSPGALLRAIATALNDSAAAGVKIHVRQGAVFCRDAVMLPLGSGRWQVRALMPSGADPDDPGDDD